MKWIIHSFPVLESTNTTAFSYPIGSIITAEEQTNGRGRSGRIWQSLKGNLFLSAVLPSFQEQTPLLSFVAGVSLLEALKDFPVRLKWPNDVLLHKEKLAGILLESHENKIIAGFGVNLTHAPTENLLYKATSLKNAISKEVLIQNLLDALTDNLALFKTQGFQPIRKKWLDKAVGLNETITVRLPNETISGIFETITPQGAISLKTNTNERRFITAGDVFLMNCKDKND